MALNTNFSLGAGIAQRSLRANSTALALSLARLSAGRRVLSARDDAAAMAIGARLGAEVAGLKQAQINAGQGSAMLQVADGGMARINDIVTRMKTLAVQAGSDNVSAAGRGAINAEFQALASEVDRISADTEFAGANLLDGSTAAVDLKVGTGTAAADEISVALGATTTAALGIGGADVATKAGAAAASVALDNAIDRIQTARATIGAGQNRLEFAAANIGTAIENTELARSNLIDLDVAGEMSNLAGKQLLVKAAISMLAQANQQPRHLLRLLV